MNDKKDKSSVEDEKTLVYLALKGDNRSLEKLVREYTPRIYRFVWFKVRNKEDAKDITQDSCIRLFRYLGHYDGKRPFYSWVLTIAMNLIRDFYRKRQKRPESLDDYGNELSSLIEPGLSVEDKIELFHAIDRLDEEERLILFFRYFQGLEMDEIAQLLEITESNVKIRLFRARNSLKKLLWGEYDE